MRFARVSSFISINMVWGPFHEQFFHHNSHSMANWFYNNSIVNYHIVIKFCTCHDSRELSWHVQNFMAITSLKLGWEQNDISIKFELRWKNCSWNGPQVRVNIFSIYNNRGNFESIMSDVVVSTVLADGLVLGHRQASVVLTKFGSPHTGPALEGLTIERKITMGSQLDKPRLFLVATDKVHVNIVVIINAIVLYILAFMYLLEIKLLLTTTTNTTTTVQTAGPPLPLTSWGMSAWVHRITTQYSFYPV